MKVMCAYESSSRKMRQPKRSILQENELRMGFAKL